MKTSLVAVGSALALCCVSSALADATDQVKAVLQDFLDQPNYTWSVSTSRGMPEDVIETSEINGQHEKGGYTKINFVTGPHILPRGRRSTRPWLGFTDEDKIIGSRWVFETEDGWKLLSELPLPVQPGARRPSATGSRPGSISIIPPVKLLDFSFRQIGIRRPDHEIAIAAAHIASVEDLGGGVYQLELTPKGAIAMVGLPKMFLIPISVGNATASITLRASKGMLIGYELNLDAEIVVMGRGRPINSKLTRQLTDQGTTIIDVPADVLRKLGK